MNDETRYYLRDLLVLALNILLSVILAETFQFSDQNHLSDDIGFLDRIVVYIFFFIPLFSLSLLISYFYRNKRNLETGRLKSSIRYRLTLSFIFVALLPSLPILFLSSNVTGKLYERFYGIDIEEALSSGEALILNEEKSKKKILVEKTRLLESFLRIQPLNLESLVAGASELNLIQSDEFYVGIYENEKPILENRVLKYKPLEKISSPSLKSRVGGNFQVIVRIIVCISFEFRFPPGITNFKRESESIRKRKGTYIP